MKTFEKLESLGFFDWLAETHNLRDTDMKAEYLDNLPLDDIHRTVVNSMAFRWFRENHNLFGQVNIHTYFIYDISNDELKMVNQYDKLVKTFEEAELACLDKLLEIVESKSE